MLTWQLNAGWEERLEHALALLEELLGGEQAGEAELVDEDARRLDGLLAHHLGLEGPVEDLAVPRKDLLLHLRVEALRVCSTTRHIEPSAKKLALNPRNRGGRGRTKKDTEEEAVHVEDDVRDGGPGLRRRS